MPWALVVGLILTAGCQKPTPLLQEYPVRPHVRWTERTTLPNGSVTDEPMEEIWEPTKGPVPSWLVRTTTRPGTKSARTLVGRYELRAIGLVCAGTSARDEPAEITPAKLVLPRAPKAGASWRGLHRVRGRNVERACTLVEYDACAGGLELRCTVEDGDTVTEVKNRYCRGVGVVGYVSRTTRGAEVVTVESRDLVDAAGH